MRTAVTSGTACAVPDPRMAPSSRKQPRSRRKRLIAKTVSNVTHELCSRKRRDSMINVPKQRFLRQTVFTVVAGVAAVYVESRDSYRCANRSQSRSGRAEAAARQPLDRRRAAARPRRRNPRRAAPAEAPPTRRTEERRVGKEG